MGISLRDQTIAQLRQQIELLQAALNTAQQRAAVLDARLTEVLVERDTWHARADELLREAVERDRGGEALVP